MEISDHDFAFNVWHFIHVFIIKHTSWMWEIPKKYFLNSDIYNITILNGSSVYLHQPQYVYNKQTITKQNVFSIRDFCSFCNSPHDHMFLKTLSICCITRMSPYINKIFCCCFFFSTAFCLGPECMFCVKTDVMHVQYLLTR